MERLVPLVTFAAVRAGGPNSNDYWTLATLLELALIGHDEGLADRVLPRILTVDSEPWMRNTTADTVERLIAKREDSESTDHLQKVFESLRS